VAVNFVKVIRVRAVVVMFAHVVVDVVVVAVAVAVVDVVVDGCVHAKCPDAKRSARKKPHRISCDMPQYFPLTR